MLSLNALLIPRFVISICFCCSAALGSPDLLWAAIDGSLPVLLAGWVGKSLQKLSLVRTCDPVGDVELLIFDVQDGEGREMDLPVSNESECVYMSMYLFVSLAAISRDTCILIK